MRVHFLAALGATTILVMAHSFIMFFLIATGVEMKNLEKAYDPLWDSLSWKSTVLALRRASARWPGRFLSVRYEDLVSDPEGRVREICAFLGLDFDPAMLGILRGFAKSRILPTFKSRRICAPIP